MNKNEFKNDPTYSGIKSKEIWIEKGARGWDWYVVYLDEGKYRSTVPVIFRCEAEAQNYIDEHKERLLSGNKFYGKKEWTEEADDILFALQVMFGKPNYGYDMFRKMNLGSDQIKQALKYVSDHKLNKYEYFD